jgi:hypothetical protein
MAIAKQTLKFKCVQSNFIKSQALNKYDGEALHIIRFVECQQ